MWEVMTLAHPFPDMTSLEIVKYVMAGGRLEGPFAVDCGDQVWKIVQSCWNEDPAMRPTFEQLIGLMQNAPWPTPIVANDKK
jgi:hypothetical protein